MLRFSECIACGRQIHKNDVYADARWVDGGGWTCVAGTQDHIPKEAMKTYTEEQIRKAWKRATKRIEDQTTRHDKTIDALMDELNEDEFPVASVWKDAEGRVLQRMSGDKWMQVGSASLLSHDFPVRPLRQLTEK